ncbi:DUF4349 domain-containing protein [Flavobacterium alkalisoli]|uniref:DUF4349 domain-containing protein n=1 Tax=Flavobacterium alkalisoli TaxID=2602769 RepID=A0A5B9FRH4_9FLAO|nr:DUF4349 domain-containing protein [Flavobacterium alkalisoli]QEE48809.1 DUF4349 domain-containing protein [Flavobacterium alkalisoli]
MKKIILLLSVIVLVISCKETVEEAYITEEIAHQIVADPSSAEFYKIAPKSIAKAKQTDPKIIKTATLHFETQNLETTADKIKQAIGKFNGQVQSDEERNEYNTVTRSLIIRIPNESFDNFIDEISKGVSYFDRKEISSRDVTEEYIDNESRIKTKKALEERYLELLKKANKVSEMLEIEKELSVIREEIESKQGRLQYLDNQVSFSSVYLQFYKTVAEREDATVSYGSKIGNALKSGFNSLSSFFIGLIQIWPFILIFVIAFILIRRRFRRKKQ